MIFCLKTYTKVASSMIVVGIYEYQNTWFISRHNVYWNFKQIEFNVKLKNLI